MYADITNESNDLSYDLFHTYALMCAKIVLVFINTKQIMKYLHSLFKINS